MSIINDFMDNLTRQSIG